MSVLKAVDLYRFYHIGDEETRALRGVSLHVDAGEMVAIQGPSGSGKSTLLSCLAGLDEPDGGYVSILENRLTRRPEAERAAMRAAEIGILQQTGNLFEQLSVVDNILLQMRLARKIDRPRLNQLIEQIGLSTRRFAYPPQLSGGEAARAGLAVALATNPRIVLADEPTGEVDAETEQHILHLLSEHRSHGGAILVVTHSDVLAARADRVIHLFDGRICND